MGQTIYRREDFLASLEMEGGELEAWEKLGLIRRQGTIDSDTPFYTETQRDRAEHIRRLIDLGYGLPEVQKILRKVGLPSGDGAPSRGEGEELITVGELAKRTGLNPRTLKYWEERGIIRPDGRSAGGFRLYARRAVALCELIRDLQRFGYSLDEIKLAADLLRDFREIGEGVTALTRAEAVARIEQMREKIALLETHMRELQQGIRRWEELLRKRKREIRQLLEKLGNGRQGKTMPAKAGKNAAAKSRKAATKPKQTARKGSQGRS